MPRGRREICTLRTGADRMYDAMSTEELVRYHARRLYRLRLAVLFHGRETGAGRRAAEDWSEEIAFVRLECPGALPEILARVRARLARAQIDP